MIQDPTGIRKPHPTLTLWTCVGEWVTVRADAAPNTTPGVAIDRVECLDLWRLTPDAPGRYEVPFGGDELTLHVTPTLPPADAGFGFYMSPVRLQYPEHEEAHYRLAAEYGANTMAPQAQSLPGEPEGRPDVWLARQLNAAARAGLLRDGVPVQVTGCDTKNMLRAMKLAEHPWPELLAQGPEEANPHHVLKCKRYRQVANGRGFRLATTSSGYYVEELAPYTDIMSWQAQWANEEAIRRCAELGCERWTFHTDMTNPNNSPLNRWAWGAFAWRLQARGNMVWAWINHQGDIDYSRAAETPEGPQPTLALNGLREGVVDYRALQALTATGDPDALDWIKAHMAMVRLDFWPEGYRPPWYYDTGVYRDEQKMRSDQEPRMDMADLRANTLQWWEWESLRQLRDGGIA